MSTETTYKERFVINNEGNKAEKYIKDTLNYIKYCQKSNVNEYDEILNLWIKINEKTVNIDEINDFKSINKFECIIEHQHMHFYTMADNYGIFRFTNYKEKNDIKQYIIYNAMEYYDVDDKINIYKFDKDTDDYINNNSTFDELEANIWYSYNHKIDIIIDEKYKNEFEKLLNEYSKLIGVEYEVDDSDGELEYTLFEFELKKEQLKPVIEQFKSIYEFCLENDIDIDGGLVFPLFAEDEDKFEKIEIVENNGKVYTMITKI